MLQESTCEYHYSARLKPWVHYVPLTHNAADVADKVDWLIAHDDLARRIAMNGFNFGRSFLRVEDSLCYISNFLYTIGSIMKDTDATTRNIQNAKRIKSDNMDHIFNL